MADAQKGDFVLINKIVLQPEQRAEHLPSSTKSVPYECRIKGFLLDKSATIGNNVDIETFIGRKISGILYQVNPVYDHHFGEPLKEILLIGNEVKHRLGSSKLK